jgi:hypothetical protein
MHTLAGRTRECVNVGEFSRNGIQVALLGLVSSVDNQAPVQATGGWLPE